MLRANPSSAKKQPKLTRLKKGGRISSAPELSGLKNSPKKEEKDSTKKRKKKKKVKTKDPLKELRSSVKRNDLRTVQKLIRSHSLPEQDKKTGIEMRIAAKNAVRAYEEFRKAQGILISLYGTRRYSLTKKNRRKKSALSLFEESPSFIRQNELRAFYDKVVKLEQFDEGMNLVQLILGLSSQAEIFVERNELEKFHGSLSMLSSLDKATKRLSDGK